MSKPFIDRTLNILIKGLDAAMLRQQTIAHNIANVNTPGYKKIDVRFEEKLKKAMGSLTGNTLSVTNKKHLAGRTGGEIIPEVVRTRNIQQRQDRNSVNLEMEFSKLAVNSTMYNALVQQVNDRLGILRYVINEGRR